MAGRPLTPVRLALACAAAALLRLSGRRAGLVLLYHELDERGGDPEREIVAAHSAAQVERQLRHLRRFYRVVGTDEILAAVRARRRGARFPVALTFDDDLRSHARTAVPLLERLGLPATFFLCGASLEAPSSFWWERLQHAADTADPRLAGVLPSAGASLRQAAEHVKRLAPEERDAVAAALDPGSEGWEQERGMPAADVRRVAATMGVGFHTRRHDPLDRLDDGRLVDALHAGRTELEVVAGRPLDQIAYPHGEADARVAAAARAAGFAFGFAVGGTAVRADDDPLLVPRLVASYGDTARFALQLVRRLAR